MNNDNQCEVNSAVETLLKVIDKKIVKIDAEIALEGALKYHNRIWELKTTKENLNDLRAECMRYCNYQEVIQSSSTSADNAFTEIFGDINKELDKLTIIKNH